MTMALSGIGSRVGGRAASRVGSFNSGISRATAGFSFGIPVFSRRGGEFFLAILTGAFDGRPRASLGACNGLVGFSSAGGGGGSRETGIDSWGLARIEGFPHSSNKSRCRVSEATKKRTKGVFREATQINYCTTRMLSK